jgi:hypothetical protein
VDGHGAQAVELVRVLGRLGWEVLTERGTRASRSRWSTGTVELPSPRADPVGFRVRLQQVCDQRGVALVAPSGDLTLACCWDAFLNAHVLSGGRRATAVFLDKYLGVQTARAHGFGVPPTMARGDADAVVAAAVELGFPCVIKPRRTFQRVGGTMRQLRHMVVDGRAEAEAAVVALTGDDGLLPLTQLLVAGPSLGVTAVLHRRQVVAYSARETVSFFPLGGGTSVWKRTIPPTTPGVGEALALMRDVGVEGIAEVEYKLAPEGPRFMELGPRIHGWIPLAELSRPGFLAAAIETALGHDVASHLSLGCRDALARRGPSPPASRRPAGREDPAHDVPSERGQDDVAALAPGHALRRRGSLRSRPLATPAPRPRPTSRCAGARPRA